MEDDLKYLICVSSLIVIFTLFLCKSNIIEPNTDHDDTTTTDTACPDNFICIKINQIQIDIDKSKIRNFGDLEADEKARLINEHPGLTFIPSSSNRKFQYGDTTITLTKIGNTPSFNMRTSRIQSDRITRDSIHDNSFQSDNYNHNSSRLDSSFFTTQTEAPIIQENNSDMFYIAGGIVLILSIVVGFVIYMKRENIKGIGKSTIDAIQKNRANIKPSMNSRRAQVDRRTDKNTRDIYIDDDIF